jgi:hypothetical protein
VSGVDREGVEPEAVGRDGVERLIVLGRLMENAA